MSCLAKRLLVVSFLALVGMAGPVGSAGAATPTFTPSTAGSTASTPYSVAIGDLNGDGKPDLATANSGNHTVTVITRNAAGTGWDAPASAGTTGTSPVSVAIGDLNGDGKPDVATANYGSNTVTVITRNTAGTGWDAPASAGTGTGPYSVAIGDLNGDGNPDLATANFGDSRVTVLTAGYDGVAPVTTDDVPATYRTGAVTVTLTATDLGGSGVASIKYLVGASPADPSNPANNPLTYNAGSKPVLSDGEKIRYLAADNAGNAESVKTSSTVIVSPATNYFTASTAGTTGNGPISVAIGDLNGDGKPDLATANYTSNTATVITRNAAGTGWDTPVTAGTTGSNPYSVAIGDMNGDGKPDLAVSNYWGSSVTVITRNTAGTGWDTPVTAGTTGFGAASVAIGDLNGDGKPDLVTANAIGSSVTVITRNAAGSGWDAPVSAGSVSEPSSVAIGDVNGDGKPDLVTANAGSANVTVITRNTAGTGWDAPVSAGTTGSRPASVAIGDMNGDGKPDLVTANQNSLVMVITRNTAGTGWDAPVSAGTTGSFSNVVAIGDLNGDGRPDLAAAYPTANTVTVLTAGHDVGAPVTTDDVPTAYVNANVSVTLTATDTGTSGVTSIKYLTGASPADPSVPANYPVTYNPAAKPVLTNGDRIRYFATDAAGNAETPRTSVAAQVDRVRPVTTDNVPGSYGNAPVAVTLTATDSGGSGVATIKYLTGATPADPSVPANNPSTYDAGSKPVLASGEKIRYFATDNVGNAEIPKTSAAAKVDVVAPITSDDVPGAYVNANVSVTLTATDASGSGVATIKYLAGASPADPSVPANNPSTYNSGSKPVLADGEKIRYFATDNVGNAENPKTSATAKVDLAAPVTTDDVPTTYQTGSVTVTLSATDAGGSAGLVTSYRIVSADGTPGVLQTYDSSAKPTLTDGEKIRYSSTDGAGNAETVHDSIAAQVDGTVPSTQVTGQPASVTSDARPTISFRSGSPTDTFQCALDGTAPAACSSPYRPDRPLSDGRHAFTVRAVSRAGVPDPTPEPVTFVVDTSSPPAAAILSGPPAESDQTTQTFDFAGEPGSTFLCALDDAAPAPCTAPVTLTGLSVGNHRFQIVSVDAAGNRSPEQVTAFEITSTPVPPVDLQPTKARILIVSTGQVTFLAGHTRIGCGVDRGVFAGCTATLVDSHGAVLASGRQSAGRGGATSLSVRLARTHKGILASRRHPDGLRATLIITVTTTKGTQLSAQRKAVFIASDRVLIATTRSATLSSSVRRELAAIGTAFSAAPHVTCTAYTSKSGSTAAARRLTSRQAKATCDLIGRYAKSAVRVAVGVGDDRPRASNSTAAGRRLNQRVIVTFIPRYPVRS